MISGLNDPVSLRTDQYKDSTNLSARAELHQRFSTNPVGWHDWVFNQFTLSGKTRVLEIGSGPGYLWQHNRTSPQNEWRIFLTDISEGMLQEAAASLRKFEIFRYAVLDICSIPFPELSFDAVIANHMLYHVPDITSALREIKRVLRTGCCLYAATNGQAHLHEIRDWKTQFFPGQVDSDWGTCTLEFSTENGADILRQEFSEIQFYEYPDSLLVDQAEPIINYIRSYTNLEDTDSGTIQLREYLEHQISEKGAIQITKESGMFAAFKR